MIDQIRENIFRITVPMPKNPLKYLNAYVLRGQDRTCLIDTGLNRDSCRQALHQGLEELSVDIQTLEVFITHMHSDHSGLAPALNAQGAMVMMSEADGQVLIQPADWEGILYFASLNGLPDDQLQQTIDTHPGFKYRPQGEIVITEIGEGDVIECAGMELNCLLTPGHTKGHLCLYEPDQGLLFAGDMLLEEITPNISQWRPGRNPLGEYLDSLDRLKDLDLSLVLPGHRRLFSTPKKRIEELKTHHHKRLEEVRAIVRTHPGNAFDIASRMSWDLNTPDWEKFPLAQKWFATGEALAHLSYLESQGEISREMSGMHQIWTKSSGS
ncbi:MAG: MBL fold metallo-hydrolase [Desulfovermiculus sp.]|nr:MBL fold metallo-hydrolase [Desulfovermiculus sp.]